MGPTTAPVFCLQFQTEVQRGGTQTELSAAMHGEDRVLGEVKMAGIERSMHL